MTEPTLANTFQVGDVDYKHRIGERKCEEGWCGDYWPKPCICGGLIHADFGDEGFDCNYWLYKKCDRCGDDYEEVLS